MLKPYLEIGKIVSTHGVRGEVRLQPWCDSPEFLKKFKRLYFDDEGKNQIDVLAARPHGNIVILKLKGVDTVDDASLLRNKVLYMAREDVKLPNGEYFIQDLFGCRVLDASDVSVFYGTLTDVSSTGANDVWHIEKDGREFLLPAVREFVKEVDISRGEILVSPIKGIFDDAD